MNVDINTRFITLIGTPLSQSFAARMQNAGYAAAGLNMVYFYTEADSAHLREIIDGIRYMPSFAGCAVTKPNKVKVLEYLDELDPLCRKMGACNTVVKKGGKLIGYNTDGMGFYKSILEEGKIDIKNTVFFCMGAGGAGRAICSVLSYYGAKKIYVSDYYEASSKALVADLNANFSPDVEFVPFEDYSKIPECGVIINATGVGMGSSVGKSPLPAELIRPDQFFFDACYNPAKTQFLLNAEEKGARILNGLGMSLYQGVAQIELWTGKEAPAEAMRRELLTILEENAKR